MLYKAQGKYARAEPLAKRELAIYETVLGPEHPDVALGLDRLAGLYTVMGRYSQAESLAKRALAIWDKNLDPRFPNEALDTLAELYHVQGRHAEAESFYKRSLAMREALRPGHPIVAQVLEKYAVLLRDTGRDVEAAKMEARAKAIQAKHAEENPAK